MKLLARSRRAARPPRLQAQLSALLALPQSRNFPRHRAVVHRNGSSCARKSTKSLRQEALEEIPQVKWMPEWGADRMHSMIAERPDWCVSRQRFWGVPIIVFYCEECGKRLEDFRRCAMSSKWFEKEGADAWYHAYGRRIASRRARSAPAARQNGARKTTFWMCGSIPAHRIWRC